MLFRPVDLAHGHFRFDSGKVNFERSPAAHLTVDPDVPSTLLHDSIHRGQTEAGAFAEFFGGEEGIKHLCLNLRTHTNTGVTDRQHNIAPGRNVDAMDTDEAVVDHCIGGLYGK